MEAVSNPLTINQLPLASRVLISVNPKAGRRSVDAEVDRLAILLRRRGFTVDLLSDLAELAGQADRLQAEGRLRCLVAVGGDGTVAELVNRTQPGVPLALFPAGTSNLLARHVGLRLNPDSMADLITHGSIIRLDAGRAGDRLFLLMISCGFDAEVVRHIHADRHANGGHISYWSYFKPILQSIRSYQCPEMRVYCDDARDGLEKEPLRARWVIAQNLPTYGWGLRLAPRADAHDGQLDLYAFDRGSFLDGLWYAAAAQVGQHERLPDCVCRRVRRLRIAADEPVAYQLDGDPGGYLPVEIEVLPERVTLMVQPTASIRG